MKAMLITDRNINRPQHRRYRVTLLRNGTHAKIATQDQRDGIHPQAIHHQATMLLYQRNTRRRRHTSTM